MVLSASSIDADEMNDSEMPWSDGLPGKEEEKVGSEGATATTVTTGTLSETTRKDGRAGGHGHGHGAEACFTGDPGLKMIWMHPEKMVSLEEVTISSFNRTNSQGFVV